MSKEEILEKRCERFKDTINMLLNHIAYKPDDVYYMFKTLRESYLLTYNDIRYLEGEPELTAKSERIATVITKNKKPPLGVTPRDRWDRKRQVDLAAAMQRYLEAGKKIPKEWLDEYNEISDRQEKENRPKTLCDECALQYKDCGCDCAREFVKKEETNE